MIAMNVQNKRKRGRPKKRGSFVESSCQKNIHGNPIGINPNPNCGLGLRSGLKRGGGVFFKSYIFYISGGKFLQKIQKRFVDTIKEDINVAGVNEEDAMDRGKRKKMIYCSNT